jgi:hypothetical protein
MGGSSVLSEDTRLDSESDYAAVHFLGSTPLKLNLTLLPKGLGIAKEKGPRLTSVTTAQVIT